MIIDLQATSTSAINRRLVDLRETGGAVALGRVLTLVIITDDADAEEAIDAANDASREHPCRVLVLARGGRRGAARLDAQIRVGGDAGASEVLVLRTYGDLADHGASVIVPLLLPDAPIVAWWPSGAPANPSADPVGAMAQRRITDSAASGRPSQMLAKLAAAHSPGDTDLAWTRVTRWRTLLAAALDQPPFEAVTSATVTGASDSPSTDLLAAWLGLRLKCPVTRARAKAGTGMRSVVLERPGGAVKLLRTDATVAVLSQPGQPDRRIALPRRAVPECLAEELRRLDPDEVFSEVLGKGLPLLAKARTTSAATVEREGTVPPRAEVERVSADAEARGRELARSIEQADPDGNAKSAADKPRKATARKSAAAKAPAKRTAAKKAAGQGTS